MSHVRTTEEKVTSPLDIPIVFEDDALLVINKPPGVVVNRAESVKSFTVQDWIDKREIFPPVENSSITEETRDFYSRSGMVHRIDKETSGLLLFAKTVSAFKHLQAQFFDHTIKKTYLAIVHGFVLPEEGEIRAPVGRLPWNKERFGIVPGGKESVTRYRVVSNLESQLDPKHPEKFSVVAVYPETGRTHQIRVHFKYLNHPLLGDYLYAGRITSRNDRLWAERVMLHAWQLTCIHPSTNIPLSFKAQIPDDMMTIVGKDSANVEKLRGLESIDV